MPIKESGEMYLETIYILSKARTSVRSVDVGAKMGYSKPSVSRAMGILKKKGYICIDRFGAISFTETGRKIAETIYERHMILTKALMYLGIDEDTAAYDACRIEHYISDRSFKAIKKHLEEYKQLPLEE